MEESTTPAVENSPESDPKLKEAQEKIAELEAKLKVDDLFSYSNKYSTLYFFIYLLTDHQLQVKFKYQLLYISTIIYLLHFICTGKN